MREIRFFIALLVVALGAPVRAAAQTDAPAAQGIGLHDSICPIMESVAQANALPIDFFVRVIWQESRFQPDVVGPITRSGARAQGIAQFMPGTAAERNLLEPFNPAEALPKSGEFLTELRGQFGNLGLAAAAYNAGPQRLRDFIAGSRTLPMETRNYVLAITGRPIEDWLNLAKEEPGGASKGEPSENRATASCRDIVILLGRAPNPMAAAASQRKVPSWCRHLHHPNINVCGSVHQEDPVIRTSSLAKSRGQIMRPILTRSH